MRTVTLEIDLVSGAGYLRLGKAKVTRTEIVQEWPLLALDYSARGTVVGVETVGAEIYDVAKMMQLAGSAQKQKLPEYDLRNLRVVTKRNELAVA